MIGIAPRSRAPSCSTSLPLQHRPLEFRRSVVRSRVTAPRTWPVRAFSAKNIYPTTYRTTNSAWSTEGEGNVGWGRSGMFWKAHECIFELRSRLRGFIGRIDWYLLDSDLGIFGIADFCPNALPSLPNHPSRRVPTNSLVVQATAIAGGIKGRSGWLTESKQRVGGAKNDHKS